MSLLIPVRWSRPWILQLQRPREHSFAKKKKPHKLEKCSNFLSRHHFLSTHAPSKIPTRAQNPALLTPVCAQLKTMHEDAFNKRKTAVLATLPYKYVPFMLPFRNKKIVVCPFAVMSWSEMLTLPAPSAARRPNVTALPGASGADAAAAFSPCKDTRIMWHRLNDSQPRGHSGPRDHAASSTSLHQWPRTVWFRSKGPNADTEDSVDFNVDLWRQERSVRGTKIFFTTAYSCSGSLGVLELFPADTGWELEVQAGQETHNLETSINRMRMF